MNYPKSKSKTKYSYGKSIKHGTPRRKSCVSKGAFGGCTVKAAKVLDRAYSIDDHVANHPQTGSIPPQQIDAAYEKLGFLSDEEGAR